MLIIIYIPSYTNTNNEQVDLGHDAQMGMSEFENFLIANDILGSAGLDLAVLDVFDSLKSLPVNPLYAVIVY
jgi:hypothetical protein